VIIHIASFVIPDGKNTGKMSEIKAFAKKYYVCIVEWFIFATFFALREIDG
jgi:hypothetical protein